MDLFTHTKTEFPKISRGRDACEAPVGKSVSDLVAMVEQMAINKASVNQILKAVRAFGVGSATTPVASIWISASAPEWAAWESFWKTTKGRTPPTDKRGGWRFPSITPPACYEHALSRANVVNTNQHAG